MIAAAVGETRGACTKRGWEGWRLEGWGLGGGWRTVVVMVGVWAATWGGRGVLRRGPRPLRREGNTHFFVLVHCRDVKGAKMVWGWIWWVKDVC